MTDNIKQVVVYEEFSRMWFLDIGSQIIVNNITTLIICPPFALITEKVFKVVRSMKASTSRFQK